MQNPFGNDTWMFHARPQRNDRPSNLSVAVSVLRNREAPSVTGDPLTPSCVLWPSFTTFQPVTEDSHPPGLDCLRADTSIIRQMRWRKLKFDPHQITFYFVLVNWLNCFHFYGRFVFFFSVWIVKELCSFIHGARLHAFVLSFLCSHVCVLP